MSDISKQVIRFANNHSAVAVFSPPNARAEDVLQSLQITIPQAIILSIGSADSLDSTLLPRLAQLYGRGIAKAANEANALIIDGGTQAGVMQLMGEAISDHGYPSTLLGVAPNALVSYPGSEVMTATSLEPNHSHFVLVDGNKWGNETAMLFNLLNALRTKNKDVVNARSCNSKKQNANGLTKVPGVVILSGGGLVSRAEVLRAVRQNLSIIIIEGTGGLADEIFKAYREKDKETDDGFMAEVIADGELHFYKLNDSVTGIARLLSQELGNNKVLLQAWETFAKYDLNAKLQQKRFDTLQKSLIALGVLSVALVVVQQVFAPRNAEGLLPATMQRAGFWWWLVYHLLIVIPIVLTILVTAANRFKQGNRWLFLRTGAESIKREIYRYRTNALTYAADGEQQLAKALEEITRRTMRTEVNLAGLVAYNKEKGFPPTMYAQNGDDGFSKLSAQRYIELRLADQINFFQRRTVKLEKHLRRLYWLSFTIGGAGTLLAAVGLQAWVALTTSLVAAFGTYLGYRNTEHTLTKYNQTATDLVNVKAWWDALPAHEQSKKINKDLLVDYTEKLLQTEMDGWIQQMQNALAGLRKEQEATKISSEVIEATITKQTTITQTKSPEVNEAKADGLIDESSIIKQEHQQPVITTGKEKMKPIGRFE